MINQSMLTSYEIEVLEGLGTKAFENDDYELEFRVTRPKITKDVLSLIHI